MVIICPYCDIEISEKLVEAEDGCCPECGTSITARNVIEEPEEDIYAKEFEDSMEDDDYEPDFVDDFDLEDDDILDDPEEEVEFQKPRKIRQELEAELGDLDDEDFPFPSLEEEKAAPVKETGKAAPAKSSKSKSTAKTAPAKSSKSKKK
ncbi:MAG: hypothetical protein IKA79_02460 [Lentisphaeria bacterium]|nr:hypothetical protein [Lentisphaeria bacterium]